MIERILPAGVVAVEARHDASGVELFAEEELALGRAVQKRRREFTTARACARRALGELGLPAGPIPTGAHGEPCWPDEVVGSITHCDGYRACAVARRSEFLTVGIDAEPNAALARGLLQDVARPEEIRSLCRLREERTDVHWDRLLFSAKESVYKAWFPLARRWLGFDDVVLTFDPRAGTFAARLLVPRSLPRGGRLAGFEGRWAAWDGILATAIAVSVG